MDESVLSVVQGSSTPRALILSAGRQGFKNPGVRSDSPNMSEKIAPDEHVCPGETEPDPQGRTELINPTNKRPDGYTKTCSTCGVRIAVRRVDQRLPYWAMA
ncbi:hypothetical protein LWF15_27695 [Kineosporia rhizophila]|uniref:hypothetical protein n=2 Tax=Kineosporia TaxID=49184 RepID=UPI001E4456B5|nr:hypothetical protein [Kineosporia rhizophila]MCE0539288.1 hypothetical protein [Kineosporia rhizophila]